MRQSFFSIIFFGFLVSIFSMPTMALAETKNVTEENLLSEESPVVLLEKIAYQMDAQLKKNHKHLSKKIAYDIVNQYLIPYVDAKGMSRSVLGKNVWNQATDKQKSEFIRQFSELVVRTYSSPLADYKLGDSIRFEPIRGGYKGKKFVDVKSFIMRVQGNVVPLNYSLILLGKTWKIYDLSVEGVSLLQSFHSQFAQELSQGDMNQLITNLKKHNQKSHDSQ